MRQPIDRCIDLRNRANRSGTVVRHRIGYHAPQERNQPGGLVLGMKSGEVLVPAPVPAAASRLPRSCTPLSGISGLPGLPATLTAPLTAVTGPSEGSKSMNSTSEPHGRLAADDLAFICGAPRSGTTLLQAVLSSAQGAVPLLGEMRYLQHLLHAYVEMQLWWADDSRYFFASPDAARREFADLIRAHLTNVSSLYGAQRIAIKSPQLTEYVTVLTELFPTCHRFAMLRDPRDVVASQLLATERELACGHIPSMLPNKITPSENTALSRSGLVRLLAEGVAASYRSLPSEGWELVRYENLVRYPERSLAAIAEITNWPIPKDPGSAWHNSVFDYLTQSTTIQGAWRSSLWGQPITSERVGAYTSILDDRDQLIVSTTCKAMLSIWEDGLW